MINNDAYKYGKYTTLNQETRWASIGEIQRSSARLDLKAETYPTAGLPLISDGETAYVDDADTHSLIFGATGSKKTRLFVMPMINMMLKAGESFIATDPKGELYDTTSGLAEKMGYKTVVLNFRDLGKGDCWNPLSLPYELFCAGYEDEAVALINDFISSLSDPKTMKTSDLFWTNTSRSLGLANMLLMMKYAKPEEVHMESFVKLCSGEVVEFFTEHMELFDDTSIGSLNFRSSLSGADRTTQNIVISLYSCISIFAQQKKLCRMLSQSTFDIRDFGRQKTAVYLIIPDEKTTLHFLITTFIKQAYEILIREAQKEETLRLPIRVNFVLDEFCNIPAIPDMPSMISAARSRNIRYFLVVQSKHQLVGKYGEDADTIKGNCDNWVFLTSKELDLLNEISELCGSYQTPDGHQRRLISVSELQRLDKQKGEALIMHARQYPIITEMADIGSYTMFGKESGIAMQNAENPDCPVFRPMLFLNAVRWMNRKDDFQFFSTTQSDLIHFLQHEFETNTDLDHVEEEILAYYDIEKSLHIQWTKNASKESELLNFLNQLDADDSQANQEYEDCDDDWFFETDEEETNKEEAADATEAKSNDEFRAELIKLMIEAGDLLSGKKKPE